MKNFFTHNLWLKVVSLLLAIVSWYAIRETISFEIDIPNIPLELKVRKGWSVMNQSEDSVHVTFRGSQEDIRLMDQKQLRAVIDLRTNTISGSKRVLVTHGDIKGVRGVRAIQVDPDYIQISLDRESEKRVSVKSRTTGKPFYGYVEELICEPAVVSLYGPAKQLKRIDWVYTEPVDVDKRVESFTKRRSVLPPTKLQTYRIEPSDVQVKVVITEKSESLEKKDIPVSAMVQRGSRLKIEITPPSVNVILTGRAEALDEIKAAVPKVFVDCVDLDPSLTYDLPVNIYLPQGKDIFAVAEPVFVHITIDKQ